MSENKSFQLAVLFSIFLHFAFVIGFPQNPFLPLRRSLEPVEISYYKIKEQKKLVGIKPESVASKLPEIKKEEILQSVKPEKIAEEKPKEPSRSTQALSQTQEKKFETVIKEEKDEAKKAAYISYYKAVREKIKACADSNYPKHGRLGEGEVFLTFTVASNGELLQVAIIDERSVDDTVLRGIALNSVRDASPFPAFPEGIGHPQITFNVIISFERE